MRLEDVGLSASRMMAGFAGGLLYSFAIRENEPKAVVVSVLAGAMAANYLTDATQHYVPNWVGTGGASFLTGLLAMVICQGVISFTKAKFKVANSEPTSPLDKGDKL